MNAQSSTVIHFDFPQQHIAEAAYYKAEKRGFAPGFEEQDWAEAEHEVLSQIAGGAEPNRQAEL